MSKPVVIAGQFDRSSNSSSSNSSSSNSSSSNSSSSNSSSSSSGIRDFQDNGSDESKLDRSDVDDGHLWTPYTQLHDACMNGISEIITSFLEKGFLFFLPPVRTHTLSLFLPLSYTHTHTHTHTHKSITGSMCCGDFDCNNDFRRISYIWYRADFMGYFTFCFSIFHRLTFWNSYWKKRLSVLFRFLYILV